MLELCSGHPEDCFVFRNQYLHSCSPVYRTIAAAGLLAAAFRPGSGLLTETHATAVADTAVVPTVVAVAAVITTADVAIVVGGIAAPAVGTAVVVTAAADAASLQPGLS